MQRGRVSACRAQDGAFDIVHAHDWMTSFAGVGMKRAYATPLVATIHATEWGRNGGLHNAMQRRISDIEWFLCYEAWRVIACSRHMQAELTSIFGVPSDKLRVIPNGVHPGQFQEADVDMARRMYGLSEEDNVILFVGRLVHEKGVQLLIEAMPKILHYWPSAVLVIAGQGPCEGELRSLADRFDLGGKVKMVGFVPDDVRNALYRLARVAVVPSLYEPFGITALEAMAARAPLVSSDVGGLSEIVRHGENGWKCYAGNVNSFADGVLHVLHSAEAAGRMSEVAYGDILAIYDWRAIADRTLKVYEEVLREARHAEEAMFR
jgi:glycogen(starch) synthase